MKETHKKYPWPLELGLSPSLADTFWGSSLSFKNFFIEAARLKYSFIFDFNVDTKLAFFSSRKGGIKKETGYTFDNMLEKLKSFNIFCQCFFIFLIFIKLAGVLTNFDCFVADSYEVSHFDVIIIILIPLF